MKTVPEKSATFDDAKQYRYSLTRRWGNGVDSLLWLMFNPSNADALKEDPTSRRVIGFSTALGFDACTVVNLYSYIHSEPSVMRAAARAGFDIIGEDNDKAINIAALEHKNCIMAWGANGKKQDEQRIYDVSKMIRDNGCKMHRLGELTKHGQPRHPLMLRNDSALKPYKAT